MQPFHSETLVGRSLRCATALEGSRNKLGRGHGKKQWSEVGKQESRSATIQQ